MAATHCQKCGTEAKTFWVGDKIWLCVKCFKEARGK